MRVGDNISIRAKVVAAFVTVLVLTIGIGAFGLMQSATINGNAKQVRDHWLPSTKALGDLAFKVRDYRVKESAYMIAALAQQTDLDAREKTVSDGAVAVEQARRDYAPLIVPGSVDDKQMGLFDQTWPQVKATAVQVITLIKQGKVQDAVRLYQGGDRDILTKATNTITDDIATTTNDGRDAADQGTAIFNQAWIWTIAAIAVAALLSVGLGWFLILSVSVPLARTTREVEALAAGNLDIAVAGTDRRDEIGVLARALSVFRNGMAQARDLAAAQERERAVREQRAERLERLMQGFEAKVSGLVGRLSHAAVQMHATATGLSQTARTTNNRSGSVASAAQQTSTNVQTVATATEELAASTQEIGSQVTHSRRIASRALDRSKGARATVGQLSDSAQKIGEVVQLISSIASQTNLLALNATIEAARAGEAGAGFAIVAAEVKALATQTAHATDEIDAKVGEIRQLTATTVSAIVEVDQTIKDMAEIAVAIAAAIEEQSAATSEIARSIEEAARGTEDVAANIDGVNQGASETGVAAQQLLDASQDLSQQAESLNGEVDSFIVSLKAA